ncbi:MAG: hypothetical protein U9R57_14115 [Thermodesulfobacteriota bacterium]|nr:hypothetical protein [Thermodesulfobacteriota bacterium]
MNQLEKLQVLLPHWIEHNQGHAEECRKWLDEVEQEDVQSSLNAALEAMDQVTKYLGKALDAAGGPATEDGHGHHHHHH